MKVMNFIKLSLIAALMMVFTIDSEPVNAATESASKNTSLTQQDHRLKRHRNKRKKHRKHRKHKRHHHKHKRDFDMNKDKRMPPKKDEKK